MVKKWTSKIKSSTRNDDEGAKLSHFQTVHALYEVEKGRRRSFRYAAIQMTNCDE